MNLRETIELIRSHEKELALFNIEASDPILSQLEAFFATQNVRITTYRTSTRTPRDIAVLSAKDEVLELVAVDTLRELITQPPSTGDSLGISDTEYAQILRHLKETTFTSFATEQMLRASREIEDRAHRTGSGTIHAGFQQCSLMAAQQDIYTSLIQQGLEVHLYGEPDVTPPVIDAGQVHTSTTDEIARMWFVVFDGGGDDTQKSALLAEEREDDSFYGVWTYDAKIVDSINSYLQRTYVSQNNVHSQSNF